MPDLQQEITDLLSKKNLQDNLPVLFCDLLNWGAPAGASLSLTIGQPVGNTITFTPISQLSGLRVFYVNWPEEKLPGVVQRRAVQKALAPIFLEHLIIYETTNSRQVAFVWARQRKDGQTELRTLPFQPGKPARTTIDRLAELYFSINELGFLGDPGITRVIDKLNAAFDVEAVTKQFFKKYRELFEELEKSLPLSEDLTVEKRRLFTQKFFNRLMFLKFLERKGWLSFKGEKDYLRALLIDYIQAGSDGQSRAVNFHRSRLNTLFFLTLNNRYGQNKNTDPDYKIFHELVGDAPFLNGGLFEKEGDDERWFFPDSAIILVISNLFYAYNFTITESTPLDIEVAVDPEMLGKIFEALVTGRHETGSYYTPKPVVAFMCREALKGHLKDLCPAEPAQAVESFVENRDPAGLHNPESVLEALRTLKVCDPACGSGAYLLGMLHELIDLRGALFSTHKVDSNTVYERKLEIIQNSLYGVDKDPFAVNIARLRLWLSLVVDDPRNPLADPQLDVSLPNLDFKIEAGDSLTAPDPSGGLKLGFRANLVDDYLLAKEMFLRAHGEKKLEWKARVLNLKHEIQTWAGRAQQSDEFDWVVEFAEVFLKRGPQTTFSGGMAAILNQTAGQMELTLGETERGVACSGFDIVLANPPYVRQEVITAELGAAYKKQLIHLYPEAFTGTADLYVAFYARAQQLLHYGGAACFISSNKWLRAGYGENLRQYLLDSQAFHLVVDFGDQPVFQDASAYPCIFLWQKQPRLNTPTFWAEVKNLQECYEDGVLKHVRKVGGELPAAQFGVGKARLARSQSADLRTRMEAAGPRLGELAGGKLYRGIITGLNEAFIINRATRDALCQADPHSAEIIKPILTGDQIHRYEIACRDTYLIWTYIGIPIQQYPAVFEHLQHYQTPAEKRGDKGKFWWELRPCDYYPAFKQPKIIYPDISKKVQFYIDTNDYFITNTGYFIPIFDWYILGVLNSPCIEAYFLAISSALRGGYLRYYRQYVETLPIPEAPIAEREALAQLVQEAQRLHSTRRERVEKFLNELGISPAQSSSRNPLEQPWTLKAEDFKKRAPKADPRAFIQARNETAALNGEIAQVEQEIDQRVAGLYGLA